MKAGILITTYRQVALVRENLNRIRNRYKILNNIPVIIVTTSEKPIEFNCLFDEFDNIYIIKFTNSPGSLNSNFKSKSKIKELYNLFGECPGGEFRQKYIAAKILYSINKGFIKAAELNIDVLLHIHSDTYWRENKENNLVNEFNDVFENKILFKGDNNIGWYNSGIKSVFGCGNEVEKNRSFCPEGIVFNINECKKYNYLFNVDLIYNSDYKSVDWNGIESILGTFAEYCLGENLAKDKIKSRIVRDHHGSFSYGLVNLEGNQ